MKKTIIIDETMSCLTKTCVLSVNVLRANSVVLTTVVLDKNNIYMYIYIIEKPSMVCV